jgi:hypothetical protein
MPPETDEAIRRERVKRGLSEEFQQTLDARVDRALAVHPQGIIPYHHFSVASSECVNLYRDGYFLSAVMVSQSVAEGLWRFVLQRNGIPQDGDRPTQAPRLVRDAVISEACADAFVRIYCSFRNDIHHMNPKVADLQALFAQLAQRNLKDLAVIEGELFACRIGKGKAVPLQPKYWDIENGTAPVFLRLD